MLLVYSFPLSHAVQLCIHSHSHELSLELIKRCWRVVVEKQAGVGRLIQLTQGEGSSARQSHNGPGRRACGREQVPLQVATPSPTTFPQPLSSPPSSVFPRGHNRLKVFSKYLKSVVRVDTAPAAFLQLHLRIKIFLVLLHYVGQVRPPAALCVVLLTVAVVVMMMMLREDK